MSTESGSMLIPYHAIKGAESGLANYISATMALA